MPRVLIVAQAVPPNGGSHATRIKYFIKELAELGWEIEILTTRIYPGTPLIDNSLQESIPSHVSFTRSFPGPLHAYAYRKKRSVSGTVKGSKKKSMKKKLLIPDTYIEWLPGALVDVFIKKKIKQKPDIILSSAVPYTSHLIALFISKKWKTPLIADYGDPWVYDPGNPRKGVRYLIERFLESLVISNSNIISVTTDLTKKLYIDKYKVDPSKLKVIPMGYDKDDFSLPVPLANNEKVRFLYTGRLEPESRDANLFFLTLKKLYESGHLRQCSFEFIGVFNRDFLDIVKNMGLDDLIKFHPWMNHRECMKYLCTADYLLLFGNNNNIQVPGKTFNYIGSGTPIIYLSNLNGEKDSVDEILKESGTTYWKVENSQSSIQEVLLELQSKFSYEKRNTANDLFSWKNRVKELSEIMVKLL
ncbi:glycosyltransferase [Paenibacillus sp. FSL P4-0502]|uniref:glycosyltransferase n=1 Tax=Paenibacillus sp. FSL P4-0502 TaxID=2975319 RepID=UPI0030F5EAF9